MSYNAAIDNFQPGSPFYGNGSDGDVVISGNTTLARDMNYNNLTIDTGGILSTASFRVFVKGVLTINGTVRNNGTSVLDNVTTGGASGTTNVFLGIRAGGTGTTTNGGGGGGATNGLGGNGGIGGGNDVRVGGIAGNAVNPVVNDGGPQVIKAHPADLFWARLVTNEAATLGGGGGGGGGAGSGAGVSSGTGGGGGGGILFIAAKRICSNTGGALEAKGGNGGNRTATDASSGAGGGGGVIAVYSNNPIPANVSLSAAGGTGGTVVGGVFATVGATGSAGTVLTKVLKETL